MLFIIIKTLTTTQRKLTQYNATQHDSRLDEGTAENLVVLLENGLYQLPRFLHDLRSNINITCYAMSLQQNLQQQVLTICVLKHYD